MQYKTLYYNVEPIAERLPDDCLKLIIQYAYDESKYNEWFQTIPKITRNADGCVSTLAFTIMHYEVLLPRLNSDSALYIIAVQRLHYFATNQTQTMFVVNHLSSQCNDEYFRLYYSKTQQECSFIKYKQLIVQSELLLKVQKIE